MNGDNVRAISILRSIRNIALDVGSSIGASKESVIEAMGMAIGSLDRPTPTPAPGALPELPAIPESLMATLQDAMNQYAHTGGCDIDAVVAAIGAYAEQCRAVAWSEGFVLVPREPTLTMVIAWTTSQRADNRTVESGYRAMIAAAPNVSPSTSKWVPIESAPKDGTEILLGWDDGCHIPRVGYWYEDRYSNKPRPYFRCEAEKTWGKAHLRRNQPTHWMPLPAPPALQSAFADDEGEK